MRAAFATAKAAGTRVRTNILSAAAWVARALARCHVTPNQVTLAGCAINVVSAVALIFGHPIAAGLLFWAGGSLDMVDGALARLTGRTTVLGAFVDSVLDRIGEGAMFAAIAYHFASEGAPFTVIAVVVALFGGMLTSYIRARAEALGMPVMPPGLVTRPERVILLVFGLVSGLLTLVIYVLAVLTCWTAWQRSRHVARVLRIGT